MNNYDAYLITSNLHIAENQHGYMCFDEVGLKNMTTKKHEKGGD